MNEKPLRHLTTLIVLLALTGATAALSSGHPTWLAGAVLSIALVKMLLVTFRFMNLRHAHLLWKSAVLLVTCAFLATLGFLASK